MNEMPWLHRIPFWLSWNGYRGSQFFWPLFELFLKQPDSKMIMLPNTFPLFTSQKDWISKTIYEGTYERSLLRFLESLTLSDVVIDVGANIGVTLWHGLRDCADETTYLAIEPSRQCWPGLSLTTSKIGIEGEFIKCAVGEFNEYQTIHGVENEAHSGGASLINHNGLRGHSEKVMVQKLDTLIEEHSKDKVISLLKIDTEGYESFVITGAKKTLSSGLVQVIVLEVSPNFGEVDYLRTLSNTIGEGYEWFALEESGFIKRKPKLKRVSVESALVRCQQWNLVIIKSDVFESYRRKKLRVFVKLKK